MDQVSRPLLIALGGMVVLLAVWLVALKPKPVALDKTPLAPTQAIPKARSAAAASDAANAKLQAATSDKSPAQTPAAAAPTAGAPSSAPAATAAKPAAKAHPGGRLDAGILRDIRKDRIVVVLFWNAQGADDIATRGALRDLDLHNGKVAVHVVPIARVGRYPAITQGVNIVQSPTTLVIGRKRNTRVITGLSEPLELSQAVDDALAGR
jgi:hypothetical protein